MGAQISSRSSPRLTNPERQACGITPMTLQGRMNATFYFLVAGMLPLGALAGGALGQALGMRTAIILAAASSL
ncbi:MAG TPA: hypothetical protein VHD90_25615, partial [Phototrophicaceae bacterium]|nr:hypothetical protein [Phototrophicaceae bacterium]